MPASVFVLDSWPVLEWLQGRQPAAGLLSAFLKEQTHAKAELWITRINFGEIVYMLPKKFSGQPLLEAKIVVDHLRFREASIDDSLVDAATHLKKHHACSYADCFAAALAMRLDAPVVTGDPEFRKLQAAGLIAVEWMVA